MSIVAAVLLSGGMLFTAGLMAVPQARAQASQLGSPVGPDATVRRPTGSSDTEAGPPVSYEQYDRLDSVAVPPPPGVSPDGIRYPGVEPRQRALESASAVRIPSGIATRLRALDSDFQVLSLRGGNVVGGVISMLAGGLAIALGIVGDVSYGSFGTGMSPYLYVYGGSGLARGVLELALMPNASGPAITFAHMPMTTMEEVEERLHYGETELASLAERSLISRVLDGSLSIATGLAIIPLMFASSGYDPFAAANLPFAIIGFATAAISTVTGIITLASSSEAERRWSAYEELRDRLAARGDADAREHERMRQREEEGDEARMLREEAEGSVSFAGSGLAGTF